MCECTQTVATERIETYRATQRATKASHKPTIRSTENTPRTRHAIRNPIRSHRICAGFSRHLSRSVNFHSLSLALVRCPLLLQPLPWTTGPYDARLCTQTYSVTPSPSRQQQPALGHVCFLRATTDCLVSRSIHATHSAKFIAYARARACDVCVRCASVCRGYSYIYVISEYLLYAFTQIVCIVVHDTSAQARIRMYAAVPISNSNDNNAVVASYDMHGVFAAWLCAVNCSHK